MSLQISGRPESSPGALSRRLLIDPGCLELGSDGYSNADGLQEPLYGVPCLLHNDGSVGTVLASSLACGHDVYTQDEDVPEVRVSVTMHNLGPAVWLLVELPC